MLRQAVIPAGGLGTRLSGSEPGRAKVLVEVAGEPLLARHLRLLSRGGVQEVFLLAGHLADQIERWLEARAPQVPRCTVVREEVPLGTAGGLSLLAGRLNDSFLVLYGDVLAEVDIRHLARCHRERHAVATLVAHPNSHPHDSDLIDADADGRILGLLPAARRAAGDYANLVSAGMYVLEPSTLRHVVAGQKQDFVRDIFPRLLGGGRVFAHRTTEYLKDMGTPRRLVAVRGDVEAGLPESYSLSASRPALFLDRDGTLNRHRGEILTADSLELLPKAARAVRSLNRAGALVVLVTNQPMLAKGRLTGTALKRIHARMETLLGREGAYLDAIYFCPHHPDAGFEGEVAELKRDCACRKPEPGMILRAMHELPVDPLRAAVVGDTWRDVLAARAAGLPSIGVQTGSGSSEAVREASADHLVEDLQQAARLFMSTYGGVQDPAPLVEPVGA